MLYSNYPSYSDYFDEVVSGDVCSALKDFLKKKKKREEWEEEGRRRVGGREKARGDSGRMEESRREGEWETRDRNLPIHQV